MIEHLEAEWTTKQVSGGQLLFLWPNISATIVETCLQVCPALIFL